MKTVAAPIKDTTFLGLGAPALEQNNVYYFSIYRE